MHRGSRFACCLAGVNNLLSFQSTEMNLEGCAVHATKLSAEVKTNCAGPKGKPSFPGSSLEKWLSFVALDKGGPRHLDIISFLKFYLFERERERIPPIY